MSSSISALCADPFPLKKLLFSVENKKFLSSSGIRHARVISVRLDLRPEKG